MYGSPRQEFTKCPFRVVDEINQGMDAVNERKVTVQPAQTDGAPHWSRPRLTQRTQPSGCAGSPSHVIVPGSACAF